MSRIKKRGAMELSFGMIFSIFLIIVFLAFAIYGMSKFLGFQKAIQIGQFANNMQIDINKMWSGTEGFASEEYNLPEKIKEICFMDISSPGKGTKALYYKDLQLISQNTNNFFFYPIGSAEGLDAKVIEHIDIQKITSEENPFCISNTNGKLKIGIRMTLGDSLVTITR